MRKKSAVIIQARMGSHRLPGKALKRIGTRSVLEIVIERVKRARLPGTVILATTRKREDDVLLRLAQSTGVLCFRGDSQDVVHRFASAARRYGVSTIVRVTGDNPLVSPRLIDLLLKKHREKKCDCSFLRGVPRGLGLAALETSVLRRLDSLRLSSADREHLTLYIRRHAGEFRIQVVNAHFAMGGEGLRLTVDTAKDLQLMRAVENAKGDLAFLDENKAIAFLSKNKKLKRINAGVVHVPARRRKIAFRVDAGFRIGGGHLMRAFTLAQRLAKKIPCDITFFLRGGKASGALRQRFPCIAYGSFAGYLRELKKVNPDLVVNDTYLDLQKREIRAMRDSTHAKIVLFDERGKAAPYADTVINGLVRALPGQKNSLRGPCYVVLRKEFMQARKPGSAKKIGRKLQRILILIGATDPDHTTALLLGFLNTYPARFQLDIILDKKHPSIERLRILAKKSPHRVRIFPRLGPRRLVALAGAADAAVTGSGLTAYELACLGVPLIVVGSSSVPAARFWLPSLGISLYLGKASALTRRKFFDALRLMEKPSFRRVLSRKAQDTVEGNGTERVTDILIELMSDIV
jgi:spore coat polysaccharide biosynthesis protein SpsF